MKIKFNSDDELPLNKEIEINNATIQWLQLFFMKITSIINKLFWMNVYINYKEHKNAIL